MNKKEDNVATEVAETVEQTLEKVKKNGLYIKLIDPNLPEAKEHCAYQSCDSPVVFFMETHLVCQKHALSLLRCFVPDATNTSPA